MEDRYNVTSSLDCKSRPLEFPNLYKPIISVHVIWICCHTTN